MTGLGRLTYVKCEGDWDSWDEKRCCLERRRRLCDSLQANPRHSRSRPDAGKPGGEEEHVGSLRTSLFVYLSRICFGKPDTPRKMKGACWCGCSVTTSKQGAVPERSVNSAQIRHNRPRIRYGETHLDSSLICAAACRLPRSVSTIR